MDDKLVRWAHVKDKDAWEEKLNRMVQGSVLEGAIKQAVVRKVANLLEQEGFEATCYNDDDCYLVVYLDSEYTNYLVFRPVLDEEQRTVRFEYCPKTL